MASESLSNVGSEEDIVVYCLPCGRDNLRFPAFGYCTDCNEHLCENCFKFHKRHTLSRDHSLLDKKEMPLIQHIPIIKNPSQMTTDHTKTCNRHKKEVIKFYCQFHDALLCNVCVTLEHQVTSCKVNYIPDISQKIVNSKEYLDMLKNIDSIINQCKSIFTAMQKSTALSNKSLKGVLSKIEKFRTEINQRLDDLETEVVEETKSIQRKNKRRKEEIEQQCGDLTKSLEERSSSIRHFNVSNQTDKLFIELKETEQLVERSSNIFKLLTAHDIKEYKFIPNGTIEKLLEKEKSIGKVVEKTIKQKIQSVRADIKSRTLVYKGEICARTPQDKFSCSITGIALVNDAYIVISDHDNQSIKIIDTLHKYVIDELGLQSNPWDVTLVTSNKIAATIPNAQTIQFLSISSGQLEKINSINVSGHCQGISCFQGKLVVTFSEPAKLQILETNGNILTTISGHNMFSYPEYVATDLDGIYISDWQLKQVTWLDWQGTLIDTFRDLAEPGGIAVTGKGTLFVGDNSKHIIEEISRECSEKWMVLKDPKCARAVCWCNEQNVLYLSSEVTLVNNYLQVYSLS